MVDLLTGPGQTGEDRPGPVWPSGSRGGGGHPPEGLFEVDGSDFSWSLVGSSSSLEFERGQTLAPLGPLPLLHPKQSLSAWLLET